MLTVEDHKVLDYIANQLGILGDYKDLSRESECVEFTDPADGRRFEIVVREIDQDEAGPVEEYRP